MPHLIAGYGCRFMFAAIDEALYVRIHDIEGPELFVETTVCELLLFGHGLYLEFTSRAPLIMFIEGCSGFE